MEYDNLHLHKSLSLQSHIHPSHLASRGGQGEKKNKTASVHPFPHQPSTPLITMQISITGNPQNLEPIGMNLGTLYRTLWHSSNRITYVL